jgi:hypothetical protein
MAVTHSNKVATSGIRGLAGREATQHNKFANEMNLL